jgi:hypothetical protein
VHEARHKNIKVHGLLGQAAGCSFCPRLFAALFKTATFHGLVATIIYLRRAPAANGLVLKVVLVGTCGSLLLIKNSLLDRVLKVS